MAMATTSKGSAFLLPLLLLLLPVVFSQDVGADPLADPVSAIDRQESQLRRLEALVESLSQSVSALESSLAACSASPSNLPPSPSALPLDMETVTPVLTPPQRMGAAAVSTAKGGGGVFVTKHKTSWSERFQFVAAARLEASPTVAAVLPYEDLDGLSKYFVIGDTRRRVYVFSSAGDLLIELPSLSDSPFTSMLSYLTSRRNESLLFIGHADGSVTAHHLWESAANGDDWLTLSVGSSKPFIRGSRELDSTPVSVLEVHQVGRVRYVIASDGSGRIRIFTENGTLYGTAIASSRLLAFVKQRLLFLTETGAGSLDLRSMVVRETECEGLNGSVAKAFSFDSSERSKAYGFTTGGDVIHIVLLGDVANLKCRVRSIRRTDIDDPVAIQTIKGYLLVANYDKVFVYNISSQYYGRVVAPRPLFYATFHEIKSLFLNAYANSDGSLDVKPLIAADREKLVVLGLGDGYIGIYRSSFPMFKVESNPVVWSGPALLFLLFLIGIWQFYVKKKDSLGWMPDEFFSGSAAASSNLLASGATDRAYADGERAGDLRELRGPGLRGPPRRYLSPPSRYPGGSGVPFRSGCTDPSLRGPADLKFRGQHIDSANFAKIREALYPNSQVADDLID